MNTVSECHLCRHRVMVSQTKTSLLGSLLLTFFQTSMARHHLFKYPLKTEPVLSLQWCYFYSSFFKVQACDFLCFPV
ncbi:hypothetical protein IWX90DRAFT_420816 [Phyllosticta citrichinensis]|uniref:Uncharacterized protein n=1 Tax=Phyllosticta citrichinensis TaxID=1130410 RepID=A0ABR1Y615_9PEZI